MTASNTETEPEKVVVECEMEASPEKLWRALTDENLAGDWLGAHPASEERKVPDGLSYRIIEAKPHSRVRYAWHDPASPDAPPIVTVELEAMSSGNTWFRLTHGRTVTRAVRSMAANTNRPPLAKAA